MFTTRTGLAAALLSLGVPALAHAQSPTTPATPPAASPGALAAFTSTDPRTINNVPTVAAAGDTVAWSQPSADGKAWELRAAVDGKLLPQVFERAPWPVDVSLGTDEKDRTVMLWSRCSPNTTAITRWRAYGCDIERITDPDAESQPRKVGGASTSGASEFAPSRDGSVMVFSRRRNGSDLPRLYERDLSTGRERKLPIGSKTGQCDPGCGDRGEIENGAVESSVLGHHFAMRWLDQANIGVSYSDIVYRGTVNGILSNGGLPGLISGTCSSRRYGSVQLTSLGTTQFVLREYSCDDTFGSVNGGRVRRVTQGKDPRDYADPQGRRIMAAASVGNTLWAVRERQPVQPPTEGVPENPEPCTVYVGGCEVVPISDPQFTPAS